MLKIKKLRYKISSLSQFFKYSLGCYRLTNKGLLPKYEILMLAHRLEKGLLVTETPKPFWGWEKAERIAALLKINKDEFSNRTGRGVLKAYVEAKKKSDNLKEVEKAVLFAKNHPEIEKEEVLGGVIPLKNTFFTDSQKEVIEQFFNSRHSCREFKDIIVSRVDVEAAIALSLRCPSACNRQVTNCYVYQSKELQTIILTTNIRAFETGEFNDWFISPGIFAGYLSLSLHLYGIGSCVYRKQLYGSHPYNDKMRKKCNIPGDEMIVLELRIGYYKDEFLAPVSNRHKVEEIVSFVKE